MKTVLILIGGFAIIVAGIFCAKVSERLNKWIYFDSVLMLEAKKGERDAIIAVIAHCVYLLSFFVFFYLMVKGEI